ncbi:hypothetical protein VQ330_003819 [Salmonella enterica]|nr:hypothetical protein [Salmonella enterica]EJJ4149529.1 hypothetical protein [Salmonella enterica]EJJ4360587.1 hypothetical protein [Salmonella enterica]ELG6864576.1 hypothetical protein [Salmonella enterica]ELK9706309.1 hypothetical protein [Salmonella enterica]
MNHKAPTAANSAGLVVLQAQKKPLSRHGISPVTSGNHLNNAIALRSTASDTGQPIRISTRQRTMNRQAVSFSAISRNSRISLLKSIKEPLSFGSNSMQNARLVAQCGRLFFRI